MSKIYNFTIQLGYAEDAILSTMCFSNVDGFDGVEEAMEHLRLTARAYLLKEQCLRQCCQDAAAGNFCPTCGSRLADVRDVRPDDVRDFFYELPTLDMDGGASILEYFQDRGWDLCGAAEGASAFVQGVARWMGREDEEHRPFMEWTLDDRTSSSTFQFE